MCRNRSLCLDCIMYGCDGKLVVVVVCVCVYVYIRTCRLWQFPRSRGSEPCDRLWLFPTVGV